MQLLPRPQAQRETLLGQVQAEGPFKDAHQGTHVRLPRLRQPVREQDQVHGPHIPTVRLEKLVFC